jgi:hypothetical protein
MAKHVRTPHPSVAIIDDITGLASKVEGKLLLSVYALTHVIEEGLNGASDIVEHVVGQFEDVRNLVADLRARVDAVESWRATAVASGLGLVESRVRLIDYALSHVADDDALADLDEASMVISGACEVIDDVCEALRDFRRNVGRSTEADDDGGTAAA